YVKVRTASEPSCSTARSEIAAGPRGSGGCGSPFFPPAAASGNSSATSAARPGSRLLKDVTGQVLVADQVGEGGGPGLHTDRDRAARVFRSRERDVFEEPLENRVQAPRSDVLERAVDALGVARDLPDGVVRESQIDLFRGEERPVLLQESVLGLGQDPDEIPFGQRVELHADRKRPWSSGIRSDGLETWNAPAAMKRMW